MVLKSMNLFQFQNDPDWSLNSVEDAQSKTLQGMYPKAVAGLRTSTLEHSCEGGES